MTLRNRVAAALKAATRTGDSERLCTLRLVNAAIKDRELAVRAEGESEGIGDAEVVSILRRMLHQRQESARRYEEAGRLDLAEREREEISVVEEFLPRQLSEDEVRRAIGTAISETEAQSLRDIGRVMGALKSRYRGQMDFGSVGPMVKDRLA